MWIFINKILEMHWSRWMKNFMKYHWKCTLLRLGIPVLSVMVSVNCQPNTASIARERVYVGRLVDQSKEDYFDPRNWHRKIHPMCGQYLPVTAFIKELRRIFAFLSHSIHFHWWVHLPCLLLLMITLLTLQSGILRSTEGQLFPSSPAGLVLLQHQSSDT